MPPPRRERHNLQRDRDDSNSRSYLRHRGALWLPDSGELVYSAWAEADAGKCFFSHSRMTSITFGLNLLPGLPHLLMLSA